MFCPNCGHQNQNGMRFCENCGAPLQASAAQPVQAPYAAVPRLDPVTAALKRAATSPVYLTAAIAYSCAVLFSMISTMSGGAVGQLVNSVNNLLYSVGGGSFEMMLYAEVVNQAMRTVTPVLAVFSFLLNVPMILTAVGLWMVFASGKKTGVPMQTAGLTIIKVLVIIGLVGVSLVLAAAEILLLAVLANSADSVGGYGVGMIVGIMLGLAVGLGIGILLYIKQIGTINTICRSIRSHRPYDSVSMFVIVMCFVGGAGNVLNTLSSLALGTGAAAMLNAAALATAQITFGLLLLNYRKAMRMLMVGAPRPQPVPQPVPQPAPQAVPRSQAAPQPQPPRPAPQPIPQPQPQPVPETTLLDQRKGTVVLNVTPMPTVRLVRQKNGSVVTIDRAQYRIGRDPGVADYIISDNTAVGRQHADILQRDGKCFVMDLNSTNHTFLNGVRLESNVEVPIQDGDELVFGDESFRVSIS